MMCNDISTRDVQFIFSNNSCTETYEWFRYLSSSLHSSSLNVRYLHAEFATYFILPQ